MSSALQHRGYESFLPLYQARRRWSDRVKDVQLPLFSGYVFCRLEARNRLPALTIPGVLTFVSWGRDPAPISNEEIVNLQAMVRSGAPLAPWPFLQSGQRVRIHRGAMRDVEGLLVTVKSHYRLVLSITLLQRSVSVEVDRDAVTPVTARPVIH